MKLLFDGHLDLALFALAWNRDITETTSRINRREDHMSGFGRGCANASLPEMRRGGVAVCVSTVAARANREVQPAEGHKRTDLDFGTRAMACAWAQGQLAYYRALQRQGEVALIASAAGLRSHWQSWSQAETRDDLPVGIIVSMECADPIVEPAQAADWYADGVRSVSLAHFGPGHYAQGTGADGPLTRKGFELLREFERAGMVLDLTHTADRAFFQSLDSFGGPVIASHTNCRALVPGDRQFSDEQLKLLIERDAVVGSAFDAWMLVPGWVVYESEPGDLRMEKVVDHIDHVCQLAGNACHAAIGTDTGTTDHMPVDYRTSADLRGVEEILDGRGYSDGDIDRILHLNWLEFFLRHLPQ